MCSLLLKVGLSLMSECVLVIDFKIEILNKKPKSFYALGFYRFTWTQVFT